MLKAHPIIKNGLQKHITAFLDSQDFEKIFAELSIKVTDLLSNTDSILKGDNLKKNPEEERDPFYSPNDKAYRPIDRLKIVKIDDIIDMCDDKDDAIIKMYHLAKMTEHKSLERIIQTNIIASIKAFLTKPISYTEDVYIHKIAIIANVFECFNEIKIPLYQKAQQIIDDLCLDKKHILIDNFYRFLEALQRYELFDESLARKAQTILPKFNFQSHYHPYYMAAIIIHQAIPDSTEKITVFQGMSLYYDRDKFNFEEVFKIEMFDSFTKENLDKLTTHPYKVICFTKEDMDNVAHYYWDGHPDFCIVKRDVYIKDLHASIGGRGWIEYSHKEKLIPTDIQTIYTNYFWTHPGFEKNRDRARKTWRLSRDGFDNPFYINNQQETLDHKVSPIDSAHLFIPAESKMSLKQLKNINRKSLESLLCSRYPHFSSTFAEAKSDEARCILECELPIENIHKNTRYPDPYNPEGYSCSNKIKPENVVKIFPSHDYFKYKFIKPNESDLKLEKEGIKNPYYSLADISIFNNRKLEVAVYKKENKTTQSSIQAAR